MDYHATFNAKLTIHTMDEGLGVLVLPYELILDKRIGDVKTPKNVWNENCFHYLIRSETEGYVEDAIAELCDSLGEMDNEQIEALAQNGSNWVVVGMLDSEFVELHVSTEMQKALTTFGLGLSFENRTRS